VGPDALPPRRAAAGVGAAPDAALEALPPGPPRALTPAPAAAPATTPGYRPGGEALGALPPAPSDRAERSAPTAPFATGAAVADNWDRVAEHEVLQLHQRFHAKGRTEPLRPHEVASLPSGQRERVLDLSQHLWRDAATASDLAQQGLLGVRGPSPEERHWMRSADFANPAEMSKLRSYQREGRLRIRGHGIVPSDEHLHAHVDEMFAGRSSGRSKAATP
jgi:hypothetical protein